MKTKVGEREKLREQILKDSIRTFKKMGKDGAPVDQVMKRAGLTSGALYSHFRGKEDLFFQSVLHDLDEKISHYQSKLSKKDPKEFLRLVDNYLSVEHLKDIEGGGTYAALAPELMRMPATKRRVVEERYENLVDTVASALSMPSEAERKKNAQMAFSIMLGSLQFARIFYPSLAAKKILSQAREQIGKIIK